MPKKASPKGKQQQQQEHSSSDSDEPEEADETSYAPLFKIAEEWFDGQFGPDGLQLECGPQKRRGKLLGGHQYSSGSIYLQCNCGNEALHKKNSSRRIYDLETWVMDHCMKDVTDTLTDDEIEQHIMHHIKVVSDTDPSINGKSLRQYCQQRTEAVGGPQLAGHTVWIFWWQEVNTGRQIEEVTKIALQKGTAFPGPTSIKGVGVWFKAEVVGYDDETGRLHVHYPSDSSYATLLYPLNLMHWGDKPPGKSNTPVNTKPPECLPLPLTGADGAGLADLEDSDDDDDDTLMRVRHGGPRSASQPGPSKSSGTKTAAGPSKVNPSGAAKAGGASAKRPPRADVLDAAVKRQRVQGVPEGISKQSNGSSQGRAAVPPPRPPLGKAAAAGGDGRAKAAGSAPHTSGGSSSEDGGSGDVQVGNGRQPSGSVGSIPSNRGAAPPKRPAAPVKIVRSPRERLCCLTQCPWDGAAHFAKPVQELLQAQWQTCAQLELDFCKAPGINHKWFRSLNNTLMQASGYGGATMTATHLPEGRTPGIRATQYGESLVPLQAALKAAINSAAEGVDASLQSLKVHQVTLGQEPSLLTQLITSDPMRGCQRVYMMYHVNPAPVNKPAPPGRAPAISDSVSFLVQVASDQQRNLAMRIPAIAGGHAAGVAPAAKPPIANKVVLPPRKGGPTGPAASKTRAAIQAEAAAHGDPVTPENKRSTCMCVVCGYWYLAITTIPDLGADADENGVPASKVMVRVGWFKSEPLMKLSQPEAAAGQQPTVKHVCQVVSNCMLQLGLLLSALIMPGREQPEVSEEDRAKQQAEVLIKCMMTCNDLVAEATPE